MVKWWKKLQTRKNEGWSWWDIKTKLDQKIKKKFMNENEINSQINILIDDWSSSWEKIETEIRWERASNICHWSGLIDLIDWCIVLAICMSIFMNEHYRFLGLLAAIGGFTFTCLDQCQFSQLGATTTLDRQSSGTGHERSIDPVRLG